MFVSARAEYACLAMMELASRFGENKPLTLTAITERHGIPKRFVVLILLQLKAGGLVRTVRGPTGGYLLTRSPEQITLAEIFRAIETDEQPKVRTPENQTPFLHRLDSVWRRLDDARTNVLRDITLFSLIPPTALDYSI